MSPDAKRTERINELTRLVGRCSQKGVTDPTEILHIIKKRAYEMASKPVADSYIQEVIRRYSK